MRCSRDALASLLGCRSRIFPFVFLSCFVFLRFRNPTDYLCSSLKDSMPSSVTWKTSYGQILFFHGALQNSEIAVYWGDECHLAADMLSGGRHITVEIVKRGKEETS